MGKTCSRRRRGSNVNLTACRKRLLNQQLRHADLPRDNRDIVQTPESILLFFSKTPRFAICHIKHDVNAALLSIHNTLAQDGHSPQDRGLTTRAP